MGSRIVDVCSLMHFSAIYFWIAARRTIFKLAIFELCFETGLALFFALSLDLCGFELLNSARGTRIA
jgi:hypothetical protein